MSDGTTDASSSHEGRPYLGVTFECCSVYYRIYRNADATAYEGQCPRCGQFLSIPIGTGGTSSRFFRAG